MVSPKVDAQLSKCCKPFCTRVSYCKYLCTEYSSTIELRLGTLENGELVLIAGFEYAGQLIQPTGRIQFTLPAEHLEGFTLTVITPDGTEEPLDYTTEKDKATFTLDFTDAKTPTILIHLTPEA